MHKNDYPTLEQLEVELDRESNKKRYRNQLISTVSVLIVVAAIAVLFSTLFFPVFRIYGSSMEPTIQEGDILVSNKNAHLKTGDVVVFSYNNKLLVKRVIGTAGQWIDMAEDGNVYVDNILLNEPYLKEKTYGNSTIEYPYQVPDGKYFVMGDNRSISQDSRNQDIGCIEEEQILGKALIRIWPFSSIHYFEE